MLIFIRENKELFSFSFDDDSQFIKKMTDGLIVDSVSYRFKDDVLLSEANDIIESLDVRHIHSITVNVL